MTILRPCGLDDIHADTKKARWEHHLTCNTLTTTQCWRFFEAGSEEVVGDAMVVLCGANCYSIVRFRGRVDVVSCGGLLSALDRMGHSRENFLVA